ncbi:hypothetical protein [Achromobacter ruhlandii]|uniref:hypothetical protein n=1 Tax=Achromobacter ruhlandii TaxID=72557 RepID=UPI0007BF9F5C|nr:hypothetical protein [Achromobacter ruhlandii]
MLLLSVYLLAAVSLGVLSWRMSHRPDGKTHGDIARSAAAGAALFAALAPPVGTLIFALFLAIAAKSLETLFTSMFLVIWSYLYGGVPALLCGLVAGACRPAVVTWRSYCWPGLLGGLYAFVFLAGFAVRDSSLIELGFPLFLGGLPGLVSGAVCARVFYGRPQATAAALA